MKVLFAVNDEKISQSIIKKYQSKYKEIISAKNVYYFNAIIKELQRDKTYDRIVIREDLEPFSNKNYDMIDKFIFEKLDNISDEASNKLEGEIPIIVICTDRREKGEQILLKMFSIGVYSALIGNDRTIDNVCDLIYTPRTKKEAKVYYRIDPDDADYKSENVNDVSETEIQNIVRHFKTVGKNEDKCVESFNSISSQYTTEQLKIIVRFLPLNTRAILEDKCPKYQEIMVGSVKGQIKKNNKDAIMTKSIKSNSTTNKIDLIDKELKKSALNRPVVIPSGINPSNVKKVYNTTSRINEPNESIRRVSRPVEEEIDSIIGEIQNSRNDSVKPVKVQSQIEEIEQNKSQIEPESQVQPVKRGRGRPPKVKPVETLESQETTPTVKRGRGRPRKINPVEAHEEKQDEVNLFELAEEDINNTTNRKLTNNKQQEETILPGFEEENDAVLPGFEEDNSSGTMLPGFDTSVENNTLPGLDDNNILPGFEESNINDNRVLSDSRPSPQYVPRSSINTNNPYTQVQQPQNNSFSNNYYNNQYRNESTAIENVEKQYNTQELASLLTRDKKIVSFVGTSKNGTSFIVNNLAAMLSSKGINTAILDLTRNKNAYYIYTQNDEQLRNTAFKCIENLRRGIAEGIKVNKNLAVYTTAPNEDNGIEDYKNILSTLIKNYSLILLDCDFNTDYNYFNESQEIYLVQSYDILTIQPLTAFLRELKDRNILKQENLRIIINKALRVKNLNEKMIIGGISSYNDPTMSYMKELFNKDTVIYTTVPFEEQTYSKYLEGLVTCEVSLNGYSRGLLDSLDRLGGMVYPLISSGGQSYNSDKNYNNYSVKSSGQFNSNINDTLNKMRRNY